MLVMKFGGTSVGNAAMMDQVLDIATKVLHRQPVLVSSAMTKVTDGLISLADHARKGDHEGADKKRQELHARHRDTAASLLAGSPDLLSACHQDIDSLFGELAGLCKGLALIKEVSPRSHDALVSYGERLSTLILWYRARARGLDAQLVDARTAIRTDSSFGSANLDKEATARLCRELFQPRDGRLIITQGFIGSDAQGHTTTLGRGGSDWSATIIGAALKADDVEIWTDVDGIMTTDPRIIPHARVIPEISYEEAAELSYFGAKVIHPSTIQPAVELGIPVWVKNTMNPGVPGTCIKPARFIQTPAGQEPTAGPIAIAGKKQVHILTVRSSRMLNAYGFLKSIFAVFEEHRVSVDLVATSEVSVSVTVEDDRHLKAIQRDLSHFAETIVEDGKSIVSMVGKNLYRDKAFLAKVFTALEGIPVRLITMGASDINLSLVIDQPNLEAAIRALHDTVLV